MRIMRFLMLARASLCARATHTVSPQPIGSDPVTATKTISILDPKHTSDMQIPALDESTKTLIRHTLYNLKSRSKAQKCIGIEEDYILGRTWQFLNKWQTKTGVPGYDNQTQKQILERLVVYQCVYQSTKSEGYWTGFPDIVDQIQSLGVLVRESGVFRGSNARILEALDIVFDDICADTGEAQVPTRIQDLMDVVLRGLSVNPQLSAPADQSPLPDCVCQGHYPCGLRIRSQWNDEASQWECICLRETLCPPGSHTCVTLKRLRS
ncbi:hypothetical protein PG995_007732 [Apiospora arundinis]